MSKDNKPTYISFIKLNGVPILPPVITPQLRKELLQYKHQAIKLEQRLENCKKLKKDLNELLASLNERMSPCSQITFGDNSHIEALNIPDKSKLQKESKLAKMTLDVIDVSQYDNNGIKKINMDNLSCDRVKSNERCNEEICANNAVQNELISHSNSVTPPKPRLIRSNSYTLENPSPILLAHIQKTRDNEIKENSLLSNNWASMEYNSYSPFESSDFGSMNTVCFINNTKDNQNSTKNEIIDTCKSSQSIDEVKSPTIEVYQTDISVQQITLNTHIANQSKSMKEEKKEIFFKKDPFDNFEPDSELVQILKDIPESAANQIIELLKKQHEEQKDRLERYDQLNVTPRKSSSVSEVFVSPNESTKSNRSYKRSQSQNSAISNIKEPYSTCGNDKLTRSSTFSMSPSQSLYYSIGSESEPLTAVSTPSLKVIDLEADAQGVVEIGVMKDKNGYWEGIDPVTMNYLKKEWAASVIGAHVRGYLTRRLLKTDKVQDLIATVKEVLLCALELHNSDNIDEKDVELHRRLINQLSAALYSFHDIFFQLSIPEKMLIIAADRQRQQEKLKKALSAKNSARSLHSSRSSKSLTLSQNSSKTPSPTKV
ncbi:hypothetical protein GWI33_020641 [Rhynchophorus ferrugineus]|uniref:Uncharacterized protein n=1 Tax=Rhynchophorus ferrugineus TaxID=354439 RepID=A0A834HNZ8_RHYFE|nr:hypothetical protein GWI33_020641 [Rhynchophorus ferrugineus]